MTECSRCPPPLLYVPPVVAPLKGGGALYLTIDWSRAPQGIKGLASLLVSSSLPVTRSHRSPYGPSSDLVGK